MQKRMMMRVQKLKMTMMIKTRTKKMKRMKKKPV
jgi:hypothetical protein